jgi:[acyl-carrier-protein] S-malonyltransferase
MRAVIFPGQGSEFSGMGSGYYEHNPAFQQVITRADAALDFDLPAYLFGTEPLTAHPERLQAALLSYQLALFASLRAEIGTVNYMAGLSLGEYGALVAAGACTLENGLALLSVRGAAMADACAQNDGGMLAVLTADETLLTDVLQLPDLWVANRNSPGQTVLAGSRASVKQAAGLIRQAGVRSVRLRVAGAFHTPFMQPAQPALATALADTQFATPQLPVLSTTTQTLFTAQNVKQNLLAQVAAPTNFQETIRALAQAGVTEFYELGERPVLGKMLQQTLPDAVTFYAPTPVQAQEEKNGTEG